MIQHIYIENFKAIQKAKVKLSDLAVFVGNNGSGKSSVIEALQTLQKVLLQGISAGFTERWFGLEKIQNQTMPHKPIVLALDGKINSQKYKYEVHFSTSANQDLYFVSSEKLQVNQEIVFEALTGQHNTLILKNHSHSFAQIMRTYIASWQFLALEPEKMYFPVPRNQGTAQINLQSSGGNLADFFSRLMDKPEVLNSILSKMRYVLPDLADFTAAHDSLRKEVFLQMTENQHNSELPSWLFSSGTLRILAMLAVLNSPQVPPIIFIEEVENGLDPRTLNLLVEEIRGSLGENQFVITTHSPYFLDLVDLSHIIVAERAEGKTTYFRPADNEKLGTWKNKFSLGKLYLMDKLKSE
jgi:predicted ATPase